VRRASRDTKRFRSSRESEAVEFISVSSVFGGIALSGETIHATTTLALPDGEDSADEKARTREISRIRASDQLFRRSLRE
jgi:hypothetical protein